ncbi:hypothetical protein PRZ48_014839 [Zasmidium cellare]|uniref:Uncharacterized protein n=1 Tax=Zasmidium cellare TaxID=395010 RepID=A0ABR0DWU0_ZASCE|nr:hypothetical protein PRZ48_014839 [Zasmidium cellare]
MDNLRQTLFEEPHSLLSDFNLLMICELFHENSSPAVLAVGHDMTLLSIWIPFLTLIGLIYFFKDTIRIEVISNRHLNIIVDKMQLARWFRLLCLYEVLILLCIMRTLVLLMEVLWEEEGTWYMYGTVKVRFPQRVDPVIPHAFEGAWEFGG